MLDSQQVQQIAMIELIVDISNNLHSMLHII